MSNQDYSSYHGTVAEVNTALAQMSRLCEQLELEEFEQKQQVIRKIVEFRNNKRAEKKRISAALWEVKVNLLVEM